MSERKRKSFSADFKAKVDLEAIHGVKTLNEIVQEHGVHPVHVSAWKKELQQHAASLFEQKRGPKPVDPVEDPEKLYSVIGRLKMELEWIKKSPVFPDEVPQKMDQCGQSDSRVPSMRHCRHQSFDRLPATAALRTGCRRVAVARPD